MRHKKEKYAILSENEELELTPNGDFVIKKDLVENYEIIDFHCHSFEGLCQLFPPFLQKKKTDYSKSLMDLSCFPFSMNLFDLNKVYFSDCPTNLFSLDGLKTKIKLFTGALVLNYATTEKLLADMNNNGISKAVIQQINPPDKNSADIMEEIVNKNERLYTFGSIHPFDKDIDSKIKYYMNLHIKGWKVNPHVCGFSIDCKESLTLIDKLAKTGLPILCCSGLGLPQDVLSTKIPSKQTKKDVQNQRLDKYEIALDAFPDTTFILAHSGCFEFDNMVNLLQKHQNVYTDISIQPAEHIKTLIEKIGSERVLFGTDYPFVTQAFSILSVLRATQNEDERTYIFSENAKRLLGGLGNMNHSYTEPTSGSSNFSFSGEKGERIKISFASDIRSVDGQKDLKNSLELVDTVFTESEGEEDGFRYYRYVPATSGLSGSYSNLTVQKK